MIYISILLIFLVFVAMFCLITFTVFKGFLYTIVDCLKKLIRRDREPCPFCYNKYSMVNFQTETEHKKVCQKCGFSVTVDDKPESDTGDSTTENQAP